jgi:nicotine blue oxidoreductase
VNRRLFGVVLAAGEGRRMGGPKADLTVGGTSLLAAHRQRLEQSGCETTVLVVRPTTVVSDGVAIVVRAETTSQAASLARALAVLRAQCDPAPTDLAIVSPVDLLPASVVTLRTLVRAFEARPELAAATPTYRGRGGHPPVIAFDALATYGRSPECEVPPLRDVLRSLGRARARVEVDDASVLGDFDRPSDLASAGRRLGGIVTGR